MSDKNKTAEIKIEATEFPDFGVGFYEGVKIMVRGALPGQRLLVRLRKTRRRMEGIVLETIEKAPNETEPACPSFGLCGGCTWQQISYEDELAIKEKNVLDLFEQAGICGFEFLGIEKSPEQTAYRNKMEYSFGDDGLGGALCLGMRKRDSRYEVVTVQGCNLVDGDYHLLLKTLLDFFAGSGESFYHKFRHSGALRNIIIRKGKRTGEIFINIVTTSEIKTGLERLTEILLKLELSGHIVGVYHTINDSIADAIIHQSGKKLFGRDFFHDEILGLSFKISTFSFFQTNTLAAEKLYETVRDFAGDGSLGWSFLNPNTTDSEIAHTSLSRRTVFDLYCGTGTIAQIMAGRAEKVVGIEIVGEAAQAAKENAKRNGIANCEFIAGDVLKEIDGLTDKPDVIILDPPRDGLNPKAVDKIIAFGAERIVYVSCKPTSLVRDLKIFMDGGYEVKMLKLHDLFPRTWHVETVVLLHLKEK